MQTMHVDGVRVDDEAMIEADEAEEAPSPTRRGKAGPHSTAATGCEDREAELAGHDRCGRSMMLFYFSLKCIVCRLCLLDQSL